MKQPKVFAQNKDGKEKLLGLFPIILANDKSIKPYLNAYTNFLGNTDLHNLSWQETEKIIKNRTDLIDALASKDVNTIEAALKLKVQPENSKASLLGYLCPIV